MGIGALLKSLHKKDSSASAAAERPVEQTEPEREEAQAMGPAPLEFNREMPVDVLADYRCVALSGKLAVCSRGLMTIERIAGEVSFPILEAGTAVLLRGYDGQLEPQMLQAVVMRSSLTECTVGSLEPVFHSNQRQSARYPLSPPANIYAIEGTPLHEPQGCRLLNISTGGACIASDFAYEMEQKLRLRVELVKGAGHTSYHCQVVRVSPQEDGSFEYGLLFEQLNKNKMYDLLRDIETIQDKTKRRIKA